MINIILTWVIAAVAVAVAAYIVPGIHATDATSIVLFAVVLGLLNAVVRPIVKILAFPMIIVTLGLALLVINALLFWLAGNLVSGFKVDGFLHALLGSLVVTIVSTILSAVLKDNK